MFVKAEFDFRPNSNINFFTSIVASEPPRARVSYALLIRGLSVLYLRHKMKIKWCSIALCEKLTPPGELFFSFSEKGDLLEGGLIEGGLIEGGTYYSIFN